MNGPYAFHPQATTLKRKRTTRYAHEAKPRILEPRQDAIHEVAGRIVLTEKRQLRISSPPPPSSPRPAGSPGLLPPGPLRPDRLSPPTNSPPPERLDPGSILGDTVTQPALTEIRPSMDVSAAAAIASEALPTFLIPSQSSRQFQLAPKSSTFITSVTTRQASPTSLPGFEFPSSTLKVLSVIGSSAMSATSAATGFIKPTSSAAAADEEAGGSNGGLATPVKLFLITLAALVIFAGIVIYGIILYTRLEKKRERRKWFPTTEGTNDASVRSPKTPRGIFRLNKSDQRSGNNIQSPLNSGVGRPVVARTTSDGRPLLDIRDHRRTQTTLSEAVNAFIARTRRESYKITP